MARAARGGWQLVPGGGKTYHGPAAAVLDGTLHVIVRGYQDRLYRIERSPAATWTTWTEVYSGVDRGHGDPAMSTFGGKVYLFFMSGSGELQWGVRTGYYPSDPYPYWQCCKPAPDGLSDAAPRRRQAGRPTLGADPGRRGRRPTK